MGNSKLSEKELRWQESWKHYNPDWEYKLWTDDSIQTDIDLINKDALLREKTYSGKSDILRYEILYKYGGLYLDTDFECLKPITPFLEDKEFVVCSERNRFLCGAFLASIPKHKYLKLLIDGIPERESTYPDAKPNVKYGPVYLTHVVGMDKGYAQEYVFPYGWWEKHRRNEDFRKTCPNAYAVHHWAGSWK